MTTFSEYLDKMGYSWNDFDRTYEMENLIEQYANERVTEVLRIHDVVGQNGQLPPKYEPCGGCGADNPNERCINCFHDFGGN
jgi:hypothetical protein